MTTIRLITTAPNANHVILGALTIYFSYATPIAFSHPSTGLVIRENDWSSTTGKHLAKIEPDKSKRINGKLFEEKLAAVSEGEISWNKLN